MQDSRARRTPKLHTAIVTVALGLCGIVSPTHATTVMHVMSDSDTVADDGVCTLREAIIAANSDTASGSSPGECPAGSGRDSIVVLVSAISLTGNLQINSAIDLFGATNSMTRLIGDGSDSVIFISAGEVTMQGFIIQGGRGVFGGGVLVGAGTTEINDSRIINNDASAGGGGLYVAPGATVTVRRTTIAGNRAAPGAGGLGGGILNAGSLFVHDSLIGGNLPGAGQSVGPDDGNDADQAGGVANGLGATLNLINTTITGNRASAREGGTGGVGNAGFAFLNNATITNNQGVGRSLRNQGVTAGGLQTVMGQTTVVFNSIIVKNNGGGSSVPNDCAGALTVDSVYDLIGDTTGCEIPNKDTFKINIDPLLGELALNGGPTRTHLPAPDSPAIDAGFPFPPPAAQACEPKDQRGILRLICDMGAAEREVQIPTSFTVNTLDDGADVLPGDGVCATANNTCSLRAAIQEANRLPGPQAVRLTKGTYLLTIPPGDEGGSDPDAAGDLDLRDEITLMGDSDRAAVIVDGNRLSRVFDVAPGVSATIGRMTIRNGFDSGGGGLEVTSGSLTLDNVIVEDNESTSSGGGINFGGIDTVFDVRNSIVRNNRASGDGGGISADFTKTNITLTQITNNSGFSGGGLEATGLVNVLQSTISGNNARFNGGGIDAAGLSLVESTVSGNSAEVQGGGVFGDGAIVNSTISGNTSATNGGGVSTSGSLSLLHVTVAKNKATAGGNGLDRFGSTSELLLQNTVLFDPTGSECAGLPPISKGHNIASDTSCALTEAGDKQATNALIDEVLRNNGGPTLNHALKSGSPAIDAAANVGLKRDQRGKPRPLGKGPDIGSIEQK